MTTRSGRPTMLVARAKTAAAGKHPPRPSCPLNVLAAAPADAQRMRTTVACNVRVVC